MSLLNQNVIKGTITFNIIVTDQKSFTHLDFCLDRLNKLDTSKSMIDKVFVTLTPSNIGARRVRYNDNIAKLNEKYENLTIQYNTDRGINTIEARLCNLGVEHFLQGPTEYLVFLHDTDIVTDVNLLSYYSWLFESAHDPSLVGAVTLSSNVTKGKPSKFAKMWYADDAYLRGTCFRRDAVIDNGPFDESFVLRAFEFDYSSRMVHHLGWLLRVGKEPNSFIKFGEVTLFDDYNKIKFLKKQDFVWFVRKWHNKGVWHKRYSEQINATSKVRQKTFGKGTEGTEFVALFDKTSEQVRETVERIDRLYSDKIVNQAISVSDSMHKKPIGKYTIVGVVDRHNLCYNDTGLLTHVVIENEYHKDLLWKNQPMK
jgi:hypothetical protein